MIDAELGAWPERFRRFFRSDIAGSWVLVLAVGVAILWANSPWGSTYATVWDHPVHIGGSTFADFTTVKAWVNGGLMAVFFFVVGLEIGREHRTGELGHLRTAVVPVVGAAGGMAGAGLVYALFNHGGAGLVRLGHPHGHRHRLRPRRPGPPRPPDSARAPAPAADPGRGRRRGLGRWCWPSSTRPAPVPPALLGALVVTRSWWRPDGGPGPPVWPVLLGGIAVWVLLAVGGVEPALAGVVVGVLVPSSGRG